MDVRTTITCPNGHQNPPDQKFCGECGAPLRAGASTEPPPPPGLIRSVLPPIPPRPIPPKRPFYRRPLFLVLAGVAVLFIAIGVIGSGISKNGGSRTAAGNAGASVDAGAPTSEPTQNTYVPPPSPDPEGKYNAHECDYTLGPPNFDAGGFPNARVIASTTIRNTGNVGIITSAKAHWDVTGQPSIVQTKTVKVAYGASKRVSFSVLIGSGRLDGLQNAAFENNWCGVKVSVTGTYGVAH